MFLPRRLGDAWHKSHPEHRYITDPLTGKRGWRYDHPAVSLDAITAEPDGAGDRHLLHARAITHFSHCATLDLLGRTTPSLAA
jgi:hypothetical protein